MEPIVIIGTGLAGYNVAKELRKLEKDAPLTLLTADSGAFYSKPMLSSAFGSGKSAQQIAMNTAEQMAVQLGATVRTRVRVTAIVPAEHVVRIGDETLRYAKLVLALGADPIRVPIQGDAAADILTVNDLDDYARLRAAVEGKKTVALIGAGLIGCEFANDLTVGGYKVHVVDIADQPLPRLLPAEGAAMMRDRLAAIGVQWHFGTSVTAVDRAGSGYSVSLGNHEKIAADVVLSAIGLRPRTELARAAGLAVNRGIVVDRLLRTSDPDVHALGDCAEVEGLVLPFVMPIMNAARALGATLAGTLTRVAYPAMPVLVKTPACPTIVSPPPVGAEGGWEVAANPESVKSLFRGPDGKLIGFALNGTCTAERAALAKELPPVLG